MRLANQSDIEVLLKLEYINSAYSYIPNTPPEGVPTALRSDQLLGRISQPRDTSGVYVIETADTRIIASCIPYFTFHRSGFTYIRFNPIDDITDSTCLDALRLFASYAFFELNYSKLNVHVKEMDKYLDIYEKCGFNLEVCLNEHHYRNANYENIYQIGLLRQDFEKKSEGKISIQKREINNIDDDHLVKTNIIPSKQILFGHKVDLSLISTEDAEKIFEMNLKSDDKNYASLAAAAPMDRESTLKLSQEENDFCFLSGTVTFGIKKKSGEIIGTINADSIDHRNRNLMVGLSIYDKSERGKGYGREALELMVDFAFLEMNMHRVYLGCFAFNDSIVQLYEKIGFKKEGVNRNFIYRNGNYYDEIVLGILRKDWFALRKYL